MKAFQSQSRPRRPTRRTAKLVQAHSGLIGRFVKWLRRRPLIGYRRWCSRLAAARACARCGPPEEPSSVIWKI